MQKLCHVTEFIINKQSQTCISWKSYHHVILLCNIRQASVPKPQKRGNKYDQRPRTCACWLSTRCHWAWEDGVFYQQCTCDLFRRIAIITMINSWTTTYSGWCSGPAMWHVWKSINIERRPPETVLWFRWDDMPPCCWLWRHTQGTCHHIRCDWFTRPSILCILISRRAKEMNRLMDYAIYASQISQKILEMAPDVFYLQSTQNQHYHENCSDILKWYRPKLTFWSWIWKKYRPTSRPRGLFPFEFAINKQTSVDNHRIWNNRTYFILSYYLFLMNLWGLWDVGPLSFNNYRFNYIELFIFGVGHFSSKNCCILYMSTSTLPLWIKHDFKMICHNEKLIEFELWKSYI